MAEPPSVGRDRAYVSDRHAAAAAGVKKRKWLVWTLIVVGALLVFLGSLTAWVKRQALDTHAWTDTSAKLLEDEEIRQALSVYIVDQLYTNVDVPARLAQRLPEDLKSLSGPLAGALREPAERSVDRLLQRPRIQAAWEGINRVTHQQLLALIEGKPRPNVSTADGDVVLDLRSFVIDVGSELGLGERLDERLPADAGQVTVLDSNELEPHVLSCTGSSDLLHSLAGCLGRPLRPRVQWSERWTSPCVDSGERTLAQRNEISPQRAVSLGLS